MISFSTNHANICAMRMCVFCLSYIAVWIRVLTPSGARVVAAENLALRKQLISLSRHIKRSPKDKKIRQLYEKVGQLTIDRDFLKKSRENYQGEND